MSEHKDSILLSGTEYYKLFNSKWLANKRGFKIEQVKLGNISHFKLTADWPEFTWLQLETKLQELERE